MFLPIHLLKALCITKLNMHPPPGPDYKMVGLCFSQIGFERLLNIPLTSLKRPYRRVCEDRVSPQSRSPFSPSFQYPFCLVASRFLELRAVFQPRDPLSTNPPPPWKM